MDISKLCVHRTMVAVDASFILKDINMNVINATKDITGQAIL